MIALRGARGATARTVARSALAIPAIGGGKVQQETQLSVQQSK